MLTARYLKYFRLFKGGNFMILAIINIGGEDKMKAYYSYEELYEEEFCADNCAVWITNFKTKGKTYAERKQFARDIGVTISNNRMIEEITHIDAINIAENLDNIAKRYGLIKEFRENGLI